MFVVLACGQISLAAEPPIQQPATAKQIQQWIQQLDDDDFQVRKQATENLFKAGSPAAAGVARSLKAKNPETRLRAKSILKRWLETGDEATLAAMDVAALEKGAPILAANLRQRRAFRWLRKIGFRINYQQVTEIMNLDLINKEITDAGLVHLKAMPSLSRLDLRNTKISDTGLAHLKEMTSLAYLRLNNTKITDRGLVHLKGMTSMRELDLRNTKISDTGLAHLKEMTSLKGLFLADTEITDAGLAHLKGMSVLDFLILRNTKITDTGLAHLKGMASMQHLTLSKQRSAMRD